MGDYPDGTMPVNIIGQTIAQLNVDIMAQTLTALGVNITAQDLAELIININAQSVGVQIQGEWVAGQDEHKVFRAYNASVVSGGTTQVNHTVTAGKTLYIATIGGLIAASSAGDRNKPRNIGVILYSQTAGANVMSIGGNYGASCYFNPPIRVDAGDQMQFILYNHADHTCILEGNALGWEV